MIFWYIYIKILVLKVALFKFDLESFMPCKNCPAFFIPCGFSGELLNKFSYPVLGDPVDFIPRRSQPEQFS